MSQVPTRQPQKPSQSEQLAKALANPPPKGAKSTETSSVSYWLLLVPSIAFGIGLGFLAGLLVKDTILTKDLIARHERYQQSFEDAVKQSENSYKRVAASQDAISKEMRLAKEEIETKIQLLAQSLDEKLTQPAEAISKANPRTDADPIDKNQPVPVPTATAPSIESPEVEAGDSNLVDILRSLISNIDLASENCSKQPTTLAKNVALREAQSKIPSLVTEKEIQIPCKVVDVLEENGGYVVTLIAEDLVSAFKEYWRRDESPAMLIFHFNVASTYVKPSFKIVIDVDLAKTLIPGDIFHLTGTLKVNSKLTSTPGWNLTGKSKNHMLFFIECHSRDKLNVIAAYIDSPKLDLVKKVSKPGRAN